MPAVNRFLPEPLPRTRSPLGYVHTPRLLDLLGNPTHAGNQIVERLPSLITDELRDPLRQQRQIRDVDRPFPLPQEFRRDKHGPTGIRLPAARRRFGDRDNLATHYASPGIMCLMVRTTRNAIFQPP